MTTPDTVVIVGTGLTGYTAAKTLRASRFGGRIVLVGCETALPYRRTALSKDLLGGAAASTIALDAESFYAENDIELRTGTTATALDTASRTLTLSGKEDIGYDALLLATGASARTLPMIDGATLRQLDDVEPLRRDIEHDRSLIVVGAGLIGCEVAATACGLGADVTVLESASAPLARVVPPEVSRMFTDLHAENGVRIHTDVALTSSARGSSSSTTITTADGRIFTSGTVLVAIGSEPNDALASAAGLDTDGGIVVDDHFRTSAEDVYAAGDVASIPNPVFVGRYRSEHWNGAAAQGAAAARAILGTEPGTLEIPWGWSSQYGKNLQFVGWTRHDDDYVVQGSINDRSFIAVAHRDGAVVGAVGMGRPKDIRAVRSQMAKDAPAVSAL